MNNGYISHAGVAVGGILKGMKDIKLAYELNPPRVTPSLPAGRITVEKDLELFLTRSEQISGAVGFLHLTDSVLGEPRMSSVCAAALLKNRVNDALQIRCNIRTGDHNLNGIVQLAGGARAIGVDGIILVKGDHPRHGELIENKPTEVVRYLRKIGFGGEELKLYLTVSPGIQPELLSRKISAGADGFVTQQVSSLEGFERLSRYLLGRGVSLIPSVMVPSEKNRRSAAIIGVDWSTYAEDAEAFVRRVASVSSEVLLTSPNHFDAGLDLARILGAR